MSSKKEIDWANSSLGERLFSIRVRNNQTLGEFAKSLGMSSGPYFSDLENGRKSNLSSTLITKICDIYKVCPKWLLTGHVVLPYSSVIQKFSGDDAKKNHTGGEIRMMGNQIIDIIESMTRLKIRIENLESQAQGKQKKNQPVS